MINLDKLQALSDAATPGPWTHAASSEAGDCHYIHGPIYADDMDLVVYAECERADAEFIAAARTAVPELIKGILPLLAAVERVRAIHAPLDAVNLTPRHGRMTQVCIGCGQDDGNWNQYPCPTIRALDETKEASRD